MKTLSLLNREQTNKLKSDPMLFFDLEKEPLRVAISDNYYGFVKQGKIQAKKASIKRFESDGVLLGKLIDLSLFRFERFTPNGS